MTRLPGMPLLALAAALLVLVFVSARLRLSDPWEQLVLNPEMRAVLLRTMGHERRLAELDPDQAADYKAHFQQAQSLLAHLEILDANRHKITRRYNLAAGLLFALCLVAVLVTVWYRRRRMEARLNVLGGYLSRLAAGDTDLEVAVQGHDAIGRIGAMIQTTSSVLSRAAHRVKALENLEAWQESSRRLAHEMRTPLTTLRLEVDRLLKAVRATRPEAAAELAALEQGVREEMARLTAFTDQYTSFAKIGKPFPRPVPLGAFVAEFIDIYRRAWPNLTIADTLPADDDTVVLLDKRLIRQVLVNLCNNSARALGEAHGTVTLALEHGPGRLVLRVADTGPGIDPSFRPRLFQPYATTGKVGEGTGLGLAISRKILLDHGGDLEAEDPPGGACFRLILPIPDYQEAT